MRAAMLLIGSLFVSAAAAAAAPTNIQLVAHGALQREGRVVATNVASGTVVDAGATAGSATQLELAPGTWQLHFDGKQTWSSSPVVQVSADGGGTAAVDVWPGTALRMRLTDRTGGAALAKTTAHIHLGALSVNEPQSVDTDCASDDTATVVCSVPVGTYDLRLTVPGYAAEYRLPARLPADAQADFGTIALARGTAIAGRVAFAEGKEKLSTVSVRLASAADGRVTTAKVNDRGWFVFPTVPRGTYRVSARTARGDISEAREVLTTSTSALELREPLVVSPPKTLAVTVVPPIPGTDRRWRLRLNRENAAGRLELVDEADADATGSWKAGGLLRGRYHVDVGPDAKSFWLSVAKDVADASEELLIDAKAVNIDGTVSLGDRPLQADLYFGGENGWLRQKIATKADGTFSGQLTTAHDPLWTVAVVSKHPAIARDVKVAGHASDDGTLHFDIKLPSTFISGKVINDDGRAEPHAIINIDGDQGLKQVYADEDGMFEIAGLAPGSYSLEASGYLKESDVAHVDITDDPSGPIELKVHQVVEFSGIVTLDGEPLPNVGIVVAPITNNVSFFRHVMSRPDGSVHVPLNAGTGDVDVRAFPAGFAFSAFHVRPSKQPVPIPISKVNGTLTVTVPAWDDASTISPVLVHRGAVLALEIMEYQWGGRRVKSDDRRITMSIPMLEPGDYALCLAPAHVWPVPIGNRCSSGTLAPYGTLELTIGDP